MKMTVSKKAELVDLAAFILWGVKEGLSYANIMTTLAHDVNGIVRRDYEGDKFFVPRSHGYRKHMLPPAVKP